MPLPPDDLLACARVLDALAADATLLAALDADTRRAILTAAGRISRLDPTSRSRLRKAMRRKDRRQRREHDARMLAATEMRNVRDRPVFVALPPRADGAGPGGEPAAPLAEPRSCYVCKAEYHRLHFFYDSLCPSCAELNYAKRHQTASLDGRVAVITGARIKIGYQAALMLLRAGATVVVTTRFPRDAAARYAREEDFAVWSRRLHIHGLDLRHAPSVELFGRWLEQTLPRLDILINNAAQTVRRPPGFYAHLLAPEETPVDTLPDLHRRVLAAHHDLLASLGGAALAAAAGDGAGDALMTWSRAGAAVGLQTPARLSQLPCTPDDTIDPTHIFPTGSLDADLQQVDLRAHNSWRMTLAEVPTPELLEVHLVNAVAPFILAARLKPLLTRDRTGQKHVINVSAMEAQFSRKKKTDKHPHTNMAKAALNMMTRTSAPDYAEHGIWMNSVDTGWVTDEDPLHHVARKQREHDFFPPLDIIDGAARICDPIFTGLLTGDHLWGKFFKDYSPTSW